ncbi:hypothetical protein ACFST9_12580 [Hymenobacter monticola]|uniref:Insecticidal toxin complex protein n=1 Tax=Hymenobacter monticola TaxID=1705399 RepID=A0ABY4B772_9BACT|nr:hypothetical protein [Hymenobacter monticola]UOE34977.1 hypothetical protein MTP16_04830 [Hymenobacter monticola]
MKKVLLVPVQLEALFLEHPTPVREGLADYTRLPYSDGQQDYNPDVPYLSEEVLTPPFQDQNLVLPAGLHLHWYLPGVLTRSLGTTDAQAAAAPPAESARTMPAAPDRWLVTRYRRESAAKDWAIEKNWLVESDWLSPDAPTGTVPCHVPYYDGNPRSTAQPFRYLGRVQELGPDWQRNAPLTGERLEYLTAVGYEPQAGATGYGEPTFAAFYPHCSSVFGFYDQEVDTAAAASGNLSYQVLGFYARPANDRLTEFIADFVAQVPAEHDTAAALNEQLHAAIKQQFSWDVTFEIPKKRAVKASSYFSLDDVTLPTQSLFSARLEVRAAVRPQPAAAYRVAMGNTGTEALSAFLADQLPGDKVLVEEQLEAVQLTAALSNRQLDLGAKFREARHEKGFAALGGETHWAVVLRSTSAQPDDGDELVTDEAVDAADLHLLNTLQRQYEKAGLDLETWQRHLFADWTKYMLCAYPPHDSLDAYPDVDEARRYIEQQYLTPMAQLRAGRGTLLVQRNEQRHLLGASATPGNPDDLATQLSEQLKTVLAKVADANAKPSLRETNKQYFLKPLAGPRYWRPTDPVVLLAQPGEANSGVPAAGRDPRALLRCPALEAKGFDPDQLDAKGLLALQQQASELYQAQQLVATSWDRNPWQPFLLEWETALFPMGEASNLADKERSYSPDFINQNYLLDETETDFRRRAKAAPTALPIPTETVYRGLSILTPNAGIKLGADLQQFLLTWMQTDLPNRFYNATKVDPAERQPGYLGEHLIAFADWLPGQGLSLSPLPAPDVPDLVPQLDAWWSANYEQLVAWYAAKPASPVPALVQNLLGAQQQMQQWQCLAQSLSGFNEALLMRQQARQLEIADPLGFAEYQDFTDQVRAVGAGKSTSAPLALNDFVPLRSGYLELRGLRLVDNFGQVQDVADLDQLVASEPLSDPDLKGRVALSPRLSQAARLNLRWLSARDSDQETNTHPDTNPICGWLLPNYLDNSLAFYDGNGQPLGSLSPNPDAPWQSAPGSPAPVTIDHIDNLHLRRVAQSLYNQQTDSLRQGGPSFLMQFIDTLESGLENIAPENFAQHPDLALLMGRPVAVVRAALDLQLLGQPAQHQGWSVFIKALQGAEPETDNFDLVEFPVRLGEHRQLNDGLLGYWPEAADGQLGPTFFSPVATSLAEAGALPAGIKVYEEGGEPLNVSVRVQGAAQNYTLLLDPRGKLHATSGILPTKVIDIPAAQYGPALRNIAVTFLVTPLLSDQGKTKINLPGEPGFNWSWLEQTAPAQWRELCREAVIERALLEEKLPTPGLWEALLAAGWLRPVAKRPDVATIVPKDQRPAASPGLPAADTLNQVFDAYGQHLQPMTSTATFAAPQVIREGWLRLSPVPEPAEA